MKEKDHWSRHIAFTFPLTLLGIIIVLVLMFYTCKFVIYLYDEFLILIETLGRV